MDITHQSILITIIEISKLFYLKKEINKTRININVLKYYVSYAVEDFVDDVDSSFRQFNYYLGERLFERL